VSVSFGRLGDCTPEGASSHPARLALAGSSPDVRHGAARYVRRNPLGRLKKFPKNILKKRRRVLPIVKLQRRLFAF
jgi:hypothetical protein